MSRRDDGPGPTGGLERMLAIGRLQAVPPSITQGRRLLTQAETHLASARSLAVADPEGAYALAYDAARKGLVGLLEANGLRPTLKGGHMVVHDATLSLLDEAHEATIRPFDRLRRRRHEVEYPSRDQPRLSSEDVEEDARRVEAILDLVDRLIG